MLSFPAGMSGQADVPPAVGGGASGQGTVLFSRGAGTQEKAGLVKALNASAISPAVTNDERAAVRVTAYDLDVHLTPATSGMAARVRLTVRNAGGTPITRVPLQVSSSLHWESFSGTGGGLAFAQQVTETDVDHTGAVSEAVVTLAAALAPGASTEIAAVYSGVILRSTARLDRIGAPADRAELADWDEVGSETTSLRGFGEVLWYPVAAAPVFLGDGARFFAAVGKARADGRAATVRLRLAVEYLGEAPHSAYFCGRLEAMTVHSENQDVPVEESPGIATAEFAVEPVGFRTMSLFVTQKPETLGADQLLSAVTEQDAAFLDYDAAAHQVQPMLAEWYGTAGPVEPMRMIDHRGQPFGDGAFLVAAMREAEPSALAPEMAEGLSHAWMHSREPWIEEGLAQFFTLLWIERTAGRDAAVKELQQEAVPLALAEPALGAEAKEVAGGQSLLKARDEVYFRTKAAAVWWMLRSMVGDDVLKLVLRSLRQESKGGDDSARMERALEQRTGTSLAWFFDDWVNADMGLPDLSIVQVTPRELPGQGGKRQGGWLVAVEVRNDGGAVAEVPVTVRSGTLTATERLRIPGRGSASTRILFEKVPEEVVVNDGSVPEVRTSVHARRITIEPK